VTRTRAADFYHPKPLKMQLSCGGGRDDEHEFSLAPWRPIIKLAFGGEIRRYGNARRRSHFDNRTKSRSRSERRPDFCDRKTLTRDQPPRG
jgi:hypothetical protein